ncbi:hypothetical protein [Heyndrickxia acidicola]|uniref:Uncharacterized protein n=1 Tax=Heyndrickxia acidicola TaxID=209389 RepID=A0ABU6MBX3_9BACI|nr:hypothetical protein [Heyndrickxia acidicola]MED1201918.1 hypothetical protein [Heyndrickxia acidicola]
MIHEEEHIIFIIELGRLIEDYHNCKDEKTKDIIYKDIMLLSDVINPKYDYISDKNKFDTFKMHHV